MPHVAGVSAELMVEGVQDGEPFAGRVIAVSVDDAPAGQRPDRAATWFLVADDRRPSPIWVAQAEISGQRLGR